MKKAFLGFAALLLVLGAIGVWHWRQGLRQDVRQNHVASEAIDSVRNAKDLGSRNAKDLDSRKLAQIDQPEVKDPKGPQGLDKLAEHQETEKPVAEKKKLEGCYSASFSHKKIESHMNGEACLSHKNLFALAGLSSEEITALNPKSICVQVNGAAVNHSVVKGKKNQITIGAVAGPNAKVTIRYCFGKSHCSDPCEIKKDEFMASLGMEEDGGDEGWDGKKVSNEESDLEKKVSDFEKERQGNVTAGGFFEGWIQESSGASCKKLAQK